MLGCWIGKGVNSDVQTEIMKFFTQLYLRYPGRFLLFILIFGLFLLLSVVFLKEGVLVGFALSLVFGGVSLYVCVWGPINEYNYTYQGIVVDKFIDVEDDTGGIDLGDGWGEKEGRKLEIDHILEDLDFAENHYESTFDDFIKKKIGLNEKGEDEKFYYINFEKNGEISEYSPLEVSFQQYDEIQVGDYIKKDPQSLELQIFYSS